MTRSNRRNAPLATAVAAALVTALVAPSSAHAQRPGDMIDPWFLTIETALAGPINSPVYDQFNLGFAGAAGIFALLAPELALGGRVRAGFLSSDRMIPQDPVDRGALDMGLIDVVLRIRPFASIHESNRRTSGFWLEVGPGAGISDGQPVFAYETGLGYGFAAGPVSIGPVLRFIHFVETEGRFGDNQVLVWTAGIEVALPDELERVPEPPPAAEPPPPEPAAPSDRDGDGILDDVDACPDVPEVYNGFEDEDGCPDEGRGEFVNDALIVDERVFFDYDSDALREAGMRQLDAVVEHWRAWGERYDRLEVSGHADVRGPETYNLELSARRAEAVRDYLTSHGVPAGVLDLHAWGESAPAIPDATTEYEHQVNRRVEFAVVWREGMRPEGIAPQPTPPVPDYVDEAPPSHRGR